MVWALVFGLTVTIIVATDRGLHAVFLARGYRPTLDLLDRVLKSAEGESVFVYAAYNNQELDRHNYFDRTIRMLRDDGFDAYRRIVVLRSDLDKPHVTRLIHEFAGKANVEIGIYHRQQFFPINILMASPNRVVIGLPKESTTEGAFGDSVSLYFRNHVVYNGFLALAKFLWKHSEKVVEGVEMSDRDSTTAVRRIEQVTFDVEEC